MSSEGTTVCFDMKVSFDASTLACGRDGISPSKSLNSIRASRCDRSRHLPG